MTIGHLTVPQGVEKAKAHIEDAVSKGTKVLPGGKPMSGKGDFFEPTVIADATPDMLLHNEEVFAPVAALYSVDSEEEAIKMANNLGVGLASCVSTIDIGRMWRVAEKLEVGMISVNTAALASGELPFDGVKQGGFGSEGGKWGLEEFMITKPIAVAIS